MRNPFRYFNSSPEIIRLAVMMYVRCRCGKSRTCFMNEGSISAMARSAVLRAVRFWWNRFGPMFAAEIRKKRSAALRALPQWRWHLDEVHWCF